MHLGTTGSQSFQQRLHAIEVPVAVSLQAKGRGVSQRCCFPCGGLTVLIPRPWWSCSGLLLTMCCLRAAPSTSRPSEKKMRSSSSSEISSRSNCIWGYEAGAIVERPIVVSLDAGLATARMPQLPGDVGATNPQRTWIQAEGCLAASSSLNVMPKKRGMSK